MSDSMHDLLVRGIAATKAGDAQEARFYLEWLLRLDPPLDFKIDAWHALHDLSPDPAEKREYLEEILSNNLGDALARRKLALLNGELESDEIIDPDQYSAAPVQQQVNDAKRFVCPKCGGRMTYSPNGRSLVCEFCETRGRMSLAPKTPASAEDDFIVSMATARGHSIPVNTHVLACSGCGAHFLLTAAELSGNCPYCHTPYALNQVESKELILPKGVIPFKVVRQNAAIVLRAWAEKNVSKVTGFDHLRGFYLPVWVFDIGGQVSWQYVIQKNSKDFTVTGQRAILRENLLVMATRRENHLLQEALSGFDLTQVLPFDTCYLADWGAETYQITAAEASLEARQAALDGERQGILASIEVPYDHLKIDTSSLLVESYRLILVPFWLSSYSVGNERYPLIVNGQTCTVLGERPEKSFGQWLASLFEGNDRE